MSTDEIEQPTLSTGKMLALFFVLVACCALFFGLGYSMGRNSVKNSAAATAPALVVSGDRPTTQAQAPPAASTTDDSPAAAVPEKEAPSSPAVTLASGGRAYYLQVAAVSKQEDADALVAALRKKQYQVFAASNLPTDKLVHVQVGPFADAKEADAVKIRLSKDGYSPILKK